MEAWLEAIAGRNRGKIVDFFGKTRFEVEVKSPNLSQWNITVLSMASLVQLAIRKQVGEQILVMQSMDNSWSNDEYYCRLYWAHALIRQYLATGRKYVLIKKYPLNKHVHLLTRLYGMSAGFSPHWSVLVKVANSKWTP